MANLLDDLFEPQPPRDPLRAAQAAARQPLPKRFYREATTGPGEGGFVLLLDGRPARTPAKCLLAVPTEALGRAVAAEWAAQGEAIDPGTMPLTRLVNSALDGVAERADEVADDAARYAGSDLLCYRAVEPERLAALQTAAWDPVLAWAAETLDAPLRLAGGIAHVAQDEGALAAVRRAVDALPRPFGLAGLHAMTTLTGSVLLALAVSRGRLTPEEAWAAAHVDERYQESLWGEDEEAMRRRAWRAAEFRAAAELVRG